MDCENGNVRPTIPTNSCENVSTSQQSSVNQVGTVRRGQVFRRSIGIRQRRSKESIEVRAKRLRADAQRQRLRRQKESQDDKERRRPSDARRQRNHRQQRSLTQLAVENNVVPGSHLGRMDSVCRHCDALHFKSEIASGRKDEYKQCYHYGSMELPKPLAYPDKMKGLLEGADMEGRNFRDKIRNYNRAMTFTSMEAQIATPTGSGPYCFRIHGQIYRWIGAFHPEAGHKPQYEQLYILDSALVLQERMGTVGNVRCNETIMKTLEDIIRRISPIAAAFKMMHEVEQEEIRRSKRQKRAALSIHMIFDINNRTRDQRRYNLPRANEVAAVFVRENGDVPKYRHVAIHPRGQNLQTISILHAHCDPMTYPILFPCENEGWHPE